MEQVINLSMVIVVILIIAVICVVLITVWGDSIGAAIAGFFKSIGGIFGFK